MMRLLERYADATLEILKIVYGDICHLWKEEYVNNIVNNNIDIFIYFTSMC